MIVYYCLDKPSRPVLTHVQPMANGKTRVVIFLNEEEEGDDDIDGDKVEPVTNKFALIEWSTVDFATHSSVRNTTSK